MTVVVVMVRFDKLIVVVLVMVRCRSADTEDEHWERLFVSNSEA